MSDIHLYISKGTLTACGLDEAGFSRRVSELPGVAEAKVVRRFDEGIFAEKPDGGRAILIGGGEPVPQDVSKRARVSNVDLRYQLPWLGGDRMESAVLLVKTAIGETEYDRALECTRMASLKTALVWGLGDVADRAANALKAAGVAVEQETAGRISAIQGFAGRFTVLLETASGRVEKQAGAVWLCGNEDRKPVLKDQLPDTKALSDFHQSSKNGRPDWADTNPYHVAFVAGAGLAASTENMRRILESALWVREETKASCYILAPHIKVASEGLEELYGRVRDAGAVFIRTPDNGPEIVSGDNGAVSFKVRDTVACADLTLHPDLTVVEDIYTPPTETAVWAESSELAIGPDGFPGPDNVLFSPSGTNRRGIFSLGPARGTDSAETLAAEIDGALAETRRIIDTDECDVDRLRVDDELCAHCLSCLRICPVGAIRFTDRPWFNPLACAACGMCMSRCPAKAIFMAGENDDRVLYRLGSLLGRPKAETGSPPRIVMFGCKRSAETALQSAMPPDEPVDVMFMQLPCGGRLDDMLILRSFVMGADGVLVAVCHEDNCRTQGGTMETVHRVDRVREIMTDVGFEPERLGRITLAPNMGGELGRMVADFSKTVGNSGR